MITQRLCIFLLTAAVVGAAPGWTRAEEHAAAVLDETPIDDFDRDHWAFKPLVRPSAPEASAAARGWARNPIDLFVLANLTEHDLSPMPAADRTTLIRRLSFDLVGLPPTPRQVDAFVADQSPDAYERLVDQLLDSPGYGERWAQHWLDLARFAETDGFEHDKVRSEAWRYRDWVINALNRDMPYDRFVMRQLAGDELAPDDETADIATGFCLAGPDMPDINSQEERKHDLLNEMTGTVGAVFLGLQMGCAQCHDHKYDPVSQGDFYRLRAVFEPAVNVKSNQSVKWLNESTETVPVSYLMIRGDWRRKGPPVAPDFPRIANPWEAELDPADTPAQTSGRRLALARWLTRGDHPLTTRVIANRIWQYHFGVGLCSTPSDFGVMGIAPTYDQLLDWLAVELVDSGWSLKQLHRLIVTSAVYRQASRPDAPHWSDEERAVARQAWEKAVEEDPTNDLLARFPRRRLEGEAIRDAMLVAAGSLSSRRGGPGVRPPLPEELVSTLLKDQWNVSPDREDHGRRSVYIFARRNLRYPIFEAFDRPDANASCARRSQSTTAPQSLLMINSELSLFVAQRLAGVVIREAGASTDAQVGLAFRRAFSRSPDDQELQTASEFLRRQQTLLAEEKRTAENLATPMPTPQHVDRYAAAALVDLCLALLNANEFIYID